MLIINFWNKETEIIFFDETLKSLTSPEQLFYTLSDRYFAYAPKGKTTEGQTLQSKNVLIGQYTEKCCKDFFEPIAKDNFIEWIKSIWTFNAKSTRRVGHPAPFPIDLPYRLIQLFSYTNGIILDSFMGSGTTGIAALKSNRNFVGFDTNEEYIALANNRIKPYLNTLALK